MTNTNRANTVTYIDDALLNRAANDDPAAWRSISREVQRRAATVCGRFTAHARDAAQEAIIQILRALKAGQYQSQGCPSAWVMTIATREALRHLRRTCPRWISTAEPVDVLANTPTDEKDSDSKMFTAEVLYSLSPEQRAVLMLRYVEGLSDEEIAEELNISASTVRSRIHRARKYARDRFDGGGA
ncbi:MAG: sigma-70 family RNA polymerase sigma factor [Polyangiaceae bacterium]|nr:sigma-70 family RNA polymerase sigma factor [Polyangiaceae bacterium]